MSGGAGTPDFFYREAQRVGYVARSAFKVPPVVYYVQLVCRNVIFSFFLEIGIGKVQLVQMQKQYKLITAGSSVLDLGCAPGAWLQVACQNLGPLITGGAVVGIDTKKVKVPSLYCDSRVKTVCADVMSLPREQVKALSPQHKGFSVILSDLCPPVSGITDRDSVLSAELGMQAIHLAVGTDALACSETQSDGPGVLQHGGHLVVKFLESEDVKELSQICKPLFRKASWLRPRATRSCSREIYLICQGLKQL